MTVMQELRRGYLSKQGHFRKNWKDRLFVLYGDRLAYYERPEDTRPRGEILLRSIASVSRPLLYRYYT